MLLLGFGIIRAFSPDEFVIGSIKLVFILFHVQNSLICRQFLSGYLMSDGPNM